MAAIRAYTTIEQSRKLAEILPLESADMHIGNYVGKSGKVDGTNIHYYPKGESFGAPEIINAWSLAALLEQLPYELCDDDGNSFYLQIYKENDYYQLAYTDPYEDFESMETNRYDDFVDACYELILKLHKLNLL